MSGKNGKPDLNEDLATMSSQRKARVTSQSAAPTSGNISTYAAPPTSRRTSRSASRKNSAEPSSGNARIPKAQDIAARASAALDNEDLRRTIASSNLKRKAERQLPIEQPSHELTKTNYDFEDGQPPQQALPRDKHQSPTRHPHFCCKCVDKLRLELARAAQGFHDQEEQIMDLNTEAQQYERLLAQKEEYIQRLLRRLENTKRPVLCTAEDDLLETLSKSNEVLRERDLEWRKAFATRAVAEIVRPVEFALSAECEELKRKLQEAEGRVKVLEQMKGVPWVPLPGEDGD